MGNCLVLEEAGKIKSGDVKILEYHSLSKVHHSLPKFPVYANSDACPQNPTADIQSSDLYYLHRQKKAKETGAVRIKLVLSKQELKEILEKEGLTLEDMMSQIQKEPRYNYKREKERSLAWQPALESISEANDLL